MSSTNPDEAFFAERPRLLGLAYRVLGSVVEAEDVVQEVWLRWAASDTEAIERPGAWLTTVTTRLALDHLKAARRRRETYVGPWLPEPVTTGCGPEQAAEAAETLTFAFLAALEGLDPVARAVFLLTDVFACSSAEVSTAVGRSPPACRQIAARARKKLRQTKPSRPTPADRDVVDRLIAAVANGDTATAMALMAEDVTLVSDGGPNRHAARRPVTGAFRVTRFLVNVAKRIPPEVAIEPAMINFAVGYRLRDPAGKEDAAVAFDLAAGRILSIWLVTNPDKLASLDESLMIS